MLTVKVKRFILKTGRNLDFKEKQHVSFDKSKVECYNCHMTGHFARECKLGRNQGKRSYGDNGRKNAPTNKPSSQALVAQDGLGGYDWSNDFDEPVNYALMAISSSSSSSSSKNKVQNCSKQCLESFKTLQKNFDSEREKHNRARLEIQGYELALESLESRILRHEKNELAWGEKYEFQNYELKCREIKINNLQMELEKVVKERGEFKVRSSDEESTPANGRFSKADGYHVVPPPITGNFLTTRADISFATELKTDTSKSKTSETVGNTNEVNVEKPMSVYEQIESTPNINRDKVIIEDWNSDDEDDVSKTVSPVKTNETQTVKTQVDKVGVLTRTGLINPVRSNEKRAAQTVNTVRPINTARPYAPKLAQTSSAIGPIYLRIDNGNPDILLQDQEVVDSGCSSHITGNKAYLLEYEDYNGGFVAFGSDPKRGKITGKGKIRTANLDFDDVYFVDELKFNIFYVSQMCDKKNSVLFTDIECLILSPSFKLLDESLVVLRAPRQNDVYSLDLKNIVPSRGITCLYVNATSDESKLWHRRLGHVNFKNINKLFKRHLVIGLPLKVFVNDHTCVACKKGKQHKASCKAKIERTIRNPLELLHMDIFGPVSIESINKKKYCSVMTDDFSRFSWVFFLATKDETNEILYTLITCLENQLKHKVKIIRCDHRTEFKNHAMNEFCAKKGIKREFSVPRTPQQNGVAERKNKTLIEAARTMLANSLLPIPFWAEVVNTACYVLNRVLITKPQNETSYELLIGKPPSISFMRPFGCPLTILDTLDPLGKFDGQSDEGYLLGYSTTSKAFRVYNKRTKRVEENMHIDFLEDQPNVAGIGPDWMFDLDFLTNTMNYTPISVENQVKLDVEDVVQTAQEKPSENALKDKDVQDSEAVAENEEQQKLKEDEQALENDLERMVAQEMAAKTMDDATRYAFEEETRKIASQKRAAQATSINKLNTGRPSVSAASTSTGANASGSSFVYLEGQIPVDASTLPNAG
ncbi:putative ribonuclease H-like domain-containing protein, partial [Tanacetum coccineum]